MLLFFFGSLAIVALADFDSENQQYIVDCHNDFRSQIAKGNFFAGGSNKPSAANMKKIKWSPDIQNSAQAHANKCVFQHSKAADRPGLGENMFQVTMPLKDADEYLHVNGSGLSACKSWNYEFQNGWTTQNTAFDSFPSNTLRATQTAWAKSSEIGCGVSQYNDNQMAKVFVVCHYSPSGNHHGANVYETGATCSQCEESSCESSSGLCL